MEQDWYSVLGVPPSASAGAIRLAWRQACLRQHPDKTRQQQQQHSGADAFDLTVRAYAVLRDAGARQAYDAALALSRRGQDFPVQEEVTVDQLLLLLLQAGDAGETGTGGGQALRCWAWDCRCGDRVAIHAAQLMSRLPLVQCQTCSLCVRILYADEAADEAGDAGKDLIARLPVDTDDEP